MNKDRRVIAIKLLIVSCIFFIGVYGITFWWKTIVYQECLTKESGNNKKENCRIINGDIAIRNNLSLYFLKRKNYNGDFRHVVAVNEKNMEMFDKSYNNVAVEGETINQYIKRTKQYIYAIYNLKNDKFKYFDSIFNINFESYIGMNIYYYFYVQNYRILQNAKILKTKKSI